jgi:hypothetical protein
MAKDAYAQMIAQRGSDFTETDFSNNVHITEITAWVNANIP